jgi:hypothetical protein
MITRDQFVAAMSAAAGAFYDVLTGASTSKSGGGRGGDGRPPKFDTSIARRGGMVQYASELTLADLIFWKERAEEPPRDPKYAAANAKQAKALGYWIAYREAKPDERWRGERNRVTITAKAPSSEPATYPRDEVQSDDDYGGSAEDSFKDPEDDDIPF